MVLIFVIVLVLFGGQKLPEFARGLGKSIREFKKAAAGVEEEFKRALEEDERKNATPKLAAPAAEPSSTYEPTPDTAVDSGGPDAGAYSPVTDGDVAQDEYHPPSDDVPSGSDEVSGVPDPNPAPASEPSEPKILPPASTPATPAGSTPAPAAPGTPPKAAPPPPSNSFENPS
jgi:sec-independent protein translocase protein TatA